MRELRCYSVSLGCPKNRVDTERLLGSLGVELVFVKEPEEAELVFINTCGFIAPAIQESVHVIAQAIADLEDVTPRPLLAVAGCLVGRYSAAELAAELPEVDVWLDNRDLDTWPAALRQALALDGDAPEGRLLSTPPSFAWLKISEGCRHACSFCTIPRIRGALRSHSIEFIEHEARAALDQGVKELVVVAQDVLAWGSDLHGSPDIRRLLDRLLPLPGLARLRMLYMYPTGLTREFLRYLRDAGAPFVPYFDVPLQHAAEGVLQRMGRPFARNPRETVERIREVFPEAALRTSLIVGFPGETDKDFAQLLRFVEETRFAHLGVFTYQAEDGTPAAVMPDQIPDDLKTQRRNAIMECQASVSEAWLAQFAEERMEILVDEPHPEWPGLHTGRTWFQAPEIDGVTYISGPDVRPGALVEADIVECREYDLVALQG
ncbi:MAG TPA: 30S ribosomal protein S12 methylthiotransferase RimO [Candidatus Avidesulfovibrio excrementigallinarum]|nr:30S ribosomal protein S12 methylthiotransferase RimO [Candidatus Avidesulfovibrio excrementigallinarum]